MPISFTSKYITEFGRTGPFLKTRPRVQRVEGTATKSMNAIITNLEQIPQIVFDHAEATVREFTTEHSKQAQLDSRSVLDKQSGLLDSSFTTSVEVSGRKITGASKNDARYAVFQELGFHHWVSGRLILPKPFMFPAFERSREAFLGKLREIFG